MAGFISLGFFVGGLIGAHLIKRLPDPLLKKIFGVFLLIVSINMSLGR